MFRYSMREILNLTLFVHILSVDCRRDIHGGMIEFEFVKISFS